MLGSCTLFFAKLVTEEDIQGVKTGAPSEKSTKKVSTGTLKNYATERKAAKRASVCVSYNFYWRSLIKTASVDWPRYPSAGEPHRTPFSANPFGAFCECLKPGAAPERSRRQDNARSMHHLGSETNSTCQSTK